MIPFYHSSNFYSFRRFRFFPLFETLRPLDFQPLESHRICLGSVPGQHAAVACIFAFLCYRCSLRLYYSGLSFARRITSLACQVLILDM